MIYPNEMINASLLKVIILFALFISPHFVLSQNCIEAKDVGDLSPLQDAEVILTDDFSDESIWIMSDNSPEPYGWIITDDPEDMPVTPSGHFSFASSKAENGHVLINSLDSPWQGDGEGRVAGGIANATPIDLREQDNVIMRFESFYMFFNKSRAVRFSPNNGESWAIYNIT
ncbi:MAG: hypothetical protein EA411_11855 [Saprospirales bacterium]|nr:MAG: hypothetical protein EA411_11855 [Saprospirales bacterium]